MEKMDTVMNHWITLFDTIQGGYRQNIKFPLPNNYEFLQQYAYHSGNASVYRQVDLTLEKMALGGIYDQIGGGFARYSTDENWKVPHFEKMLYDNAQLISLYSRAYQRTQKPLYREIVYQTLGWAYREMLTPEGAFYCALDADSEGEEGKFYVWEEKELETLLGEDYPFAKTYFNIGRASKWEGKHILQRKSSDEVFAQNEGYSLEEVQEKAKSIRTTLLEERDKRIRPGLDDKSLTSWNALMQIALLDAYTTFGDERFLKGALANAQWLDKYQLDKNGKLFHSFKAGQSKISGFLEDYSFAIQAFIQLYEATFDEKWLTKADLMATYAMNHFYNESNGLFYFTSDEESSLVARKMEIEDNVIPASNSVMANALYDLGILLDKRYYKDVAKQMVANVLPQMNERGMNYSNWAILNLNLANPYYEIAITGKDWKITPGWTE